MYNEALARRLGCTKTEFIGRNLCELYLPEAIEKMDWDREVFERAGELHDADRVLRRTR